MEFIDLGKGFIGLFVGTCLAGQGGKCVSLKWVCVLGFMFILYAGSELLCITGAYAFRINSNGLAQFNLINFMRKLLPPLINFDTKF